MYDLCSEKLLVISVSPGVCEGKGRSTSMIDHNGDTEFTMVLQTIQWELSRCFKDTHPPFTVAPQNVSFRLDPALLARYSSNATTISTEKVWKLPLLLGAISTGA
jgi:hypothetical protein